MTPPIAKLYRNAAPNALGGPPPAIGAEFCQGYKSLDNFRHGRVIAVARVTNGEAVWAAILQPPKGKLRLMDNLDIHTGNWRTIDRAEEEPE